MVNSHRCTSLAPLATSAATAASGPLDGLPVCLSSRFSVQLNIGLHRLDSRLGAIYLARQQCALMKKRNRHRVLQAIQMVSLVAPKFGLVAPPLKGVEQHKFHVR